MKEKIENLQIELQNKESQIDEFRNYSQEFKFLGNLKCEIDFLKEELEKKQIENI